MRRPIAALLSSLVILVGQSAGATNYYVYNKFEAKIEHEAGQSAKRKKK